MPGTELAGRYRVGGVLGQGGFGVTYRGYDGRLATMVAIKEYYPLGGVVRKSDGVVSPLVGPGEEIFEYGRGKFLEEARTLARLRHLQKVVSVFDFFEDNNTAYIIMEFLSGITLKQLQLKYKENRIPVTSALPVFINVLSALTDIHKNNILHRDISPDNILIDNAGDIKLLDFGAARQALSCKSQRMTVILKSGYAPLEQYSGVSNHGPWSDLYAAGATFYNCLSGTKPVDSLSRLMEDTLPSLSALGVKGVSQVEQAIMKALAIQPKDRWQTAAEFAEELQRGGEASRLPSPDVTRAVGAKPPPAALASPDKPREPAGPGTVGGRAKIVGAAVDVVPDTVVLANVNRPGSIPDELSPERKRGARLASQPTSDQEVGRQVPVAELQKALQEHARFLAGKINGRRLNLSMSSLGGLKLAGVNLSQAELSAVNFTHCDLSHADFTIANLFCANFSGANLSHAKFNRCDLRGAQFDGAELTGASFVDADCREGIMMIRRKSGQLDDVKEVISKRVVSFANAKMSGAVFCNANLGSAKFEQAVLENANFSGADLRDADMAGAVLKNAKFDKAKLLDCNFQDACLDGVNTGAAEFQGAKIVRELGQIEESLQQKINDHRTWVESLSHHGKRLVLKHGDLSGLQMANVDWSAAELISVDLTDINLNKAKVSMMDFTGSTLNGACLAAVDARGAKFISCHMVNADFTGALISPIMMGGGKKVCATFTRSDLRGASFEAADCQDADFRDADLRKVKFQNAILKRANFTGAMVDDAIFTDAVLDGAIGLKREG